MIDLKDIIYTVKFFDGDKELYLPISNNGQNIIYKNNEYNPNYLPNLGITSYPTKPILEYNGEILTLFDPTTNLYFDRRDNKNTWSKTNPTPAYQMTPEIVFGTTGYIIIEDTQTPIIVGQQPTVKQIGWFGAATTGNNKRLAPNDTTKLYLLNTSDTYNYSSNFVYCVNKWTNTNSWNNRIRNNRI